MNPLSDPIPGKCSVIEHSVSGRRSPPVVKTVKTVKHRKIMKRPCG